MTGGDSVGENTSGGAPGEVLPEGERGVGQGMPVRYGARFATTSVWYADEDAVQRQLGAAPESPGVQVLAGREALPSLRRRDRRRRIVTLSLYGTTIVVCALGLWGVASIALG